MGPSQSLIAIVPCNDLDASEAFYRRLGFRPVEDDGSADGDVLYRLFYRILQDTSGAAVHLARAVDGWLTPGRNPFALYFRRPDVDELATALRSEIVEGGSPAHKPWGMYEFAVSDPDSTLIRIGWPSHLRAAANAAAPPEGAAGGAVRRNRSMPQATVIPVLGYPDVGSAAHWLCAAFGFSVRLRIADHRIQLNVGDGAVAIAQGSAPHEAAMTDSVMVRVADIDRHHAAAVRHGAVILQPPTDHPYGERQYVARDPAGRRWAFSQSIADVPPEQWGGEAVNL